MAVEGEGNWFATFNEKEFKYLSENVESEQHLIKLLNGVIFQILTSSWIDKLQL